jgi:hypothetical protein
MRVSIAGRAFVLDAEDREIDDPAILRGFDGLTYEDEVFTDYLGGPEEEDALLAALEKGGYLRLRYKADVNQLWVVTEYATKRTLTAEELQLLADYTTGQWSDGIGENFHGLSEERHGYAVDCFRRTQDDDSLHPVIEQT